MAIAANSRDIIGCVASWAKNSSAPASRIVAETKSPAPTMKGEPPARTLASVESEKGADYFFGPAGAAGATGAGTAGGAAGAGVTAAGLAPLAPFLGSALVSPSPAEPELMS